MKRLTPIIVIAAVATALPVASAQARPAGGGAFGILRYDANENGQLTYQEYSEGLRAQFAEIDGNGDGVSTPDERKAAREARRSEGQTARFAALDTNGDGQVSGEEFAAMSERRGDGKRDGRGAGGRRGDRGGERGMRQENVSYDQFSERGLERFGEIDANGDQVIDQSELHAAMEKRRPT